MRKLVIFLLLLCSVILIFAREKAESGWKNGILIHRSKDKTFSMKLDVRMYLDYTNYFEEDDHLANGSNLRRTRFAVKSVLWRNWEAEFDLDLATNQVEIKDMWAAYSGVPHFKFKLGHYKVPFSLEELTSSRYITFMERAYPNVFAPGRKMSAGVTYWNNYITASAVLHGQSIEEDKNLEEDEGYGYTSRLTYAPFLKDEVTLHLGASYSWLTPDDNSGIFELKEEPEAKQGNTEFLDTSEINGVENTVSYGWESALDWRSVHLQGEYIVCEVNRQDGLDTYEFEGGYAYISWLVTGEHRPYNTSEGEFGKITPRRKTGALELAFRYSYLDLSDYEIQQQTYIGVQGGMSNSYTGGISWYFNPNFKFMLNYSYIDNSHFADGANDFPPDYDFSIIQTRLLVQF